MPPPTRDTQMNPTLGRSHTQPFQPVLSPARHVPTFCQQPLTSYPDAACTPWLSIAGLSVLSLSFGISGRPAQHSLAASQACTLTCIIQMRTFRLKTSATLCIKLTLGLKKMTVAWISTARNLWSPG